MKMRTTLPYPFEKAPYFTLEGLKQATGIESQNSVRVLLYRWRRAGKILQLKRGVFMAGRFHEQHRAAPLFSAAVSSLPEPVEDEQGEIG